MVETKAKDPIFENRFLIFSLLLFLFLFFILLFFLPFSIFGQDGYHAWMAVISEYLKGEGHFPYSPIIFGGQNLKNIYGELPIWKILKWSWMYPERLLNITFHFFYLSLIVPVIFIYRDLKSKPINAPELFLLCFYCLFCPIITNRVYAGHINILFGMLPILYLMTLPTHGRIPYKIFSILVISCALSTHSHQIILYHLFWIPFVIAYFRFLKISWKKIIIEVSPSFLLAFIITSPMLWGFYQHSLGPEGLRGLQQKVVYSYLVTDIKDFWNLIFSSLNELTFQRDFFYFHEINYPLGLTFLPFLNRNIFKPGRNQILVLILLVSFIFTLLFSMNMTPFNLIAEIPIMSAFRVPQRSLMFFSFMIPLLFMEKYIDTLSWKHICLFIVFILLGQYVRHMDFYLYFLILPLVFLSLRFFISPAPGLKSAMFLIVFSGLFMGQMIKWQLITRDAQVYQKYQKIVEALIKSSFPQGPINSPLAIIHFESTERLPLNYVANRLGVRTVEGYGHPPASLVRSYEKITGVKRDPTDNFFFFKSTDRNYMQLLKNFKITHIVHYQNDGRFMIENRR